MLESEKVQARLSKRINIDDLGYESKSKAQMLELKDRLKINHKNKESS